MRLVLLAAALVAATAPSASAAPTTVTGRTCGMDWPSTSSPEGTIAAGPMAVTDPASLAAGTTVAVECWVGVGDYTYQNHSGKLGVHSAYGPVASIGPGLVLYHASPADPIFVCTTLKIRSPTGSVTEYYFDVGGTFTTSRTASCNIAIRVDPGGNTSMTAPQRPFAQTF